MSDALPIELKSGDQQILADDQIPYQAYQAIYHKLTRKTERLNRSFAGCYDVDFASVQNLHSTLEQTIRQYGPKLKRSEISVSLKEDKVHRFSSFERFRAYGFTENVPTRRIVYELNFVIILPPEIPAAQEIKQAYKIGVMIDQDFYEESDSEPDREIAFRMFGDRNIELFIEYVDHSVAAAIEANVASWVGTLVKKPNSPLLRWFLCREFEISYNLPRLAIASIFLVLAAVGVSDFLSSKGISSIPEQALAMGALFLVLQVLLKISTKIFHDSLHALRQRTFVNLTVGDGGRITDYARRRGRAKAMMGFAITSVLAPIALAFFV